MSDKNAKAKDVYILHEAYKDGDVDTIGVYDSVRALCRGMAFCVAGEYLAEKDLDRSGRRIRREDVFNIAAKIARLLPDLLKLDFSGDECRDGDTLYGFERYTLEGEESTVESANDKEVCGTPHL